MSEDEAVAVAAPSAEEGGNDDELLKDLKPTEEAKALSLAAKVCGTVYVYV